MSLSPTDEQHQIARLENQVTALVAANQLLIETLLQVGKMTGSLSPAELETLRGQLIALRSVKPKN